VGNINQQNQQPNDQQTAIPIRSGKHHTQLNLTKINSYTISSLFSISDMDPRCSAIRAIPTNNNNNDNDNDDNDNDNDNDDNDNDNYNDNDNRI
jgi:hypothetical protein